MSSEIAVKVENVSKRYRIGEEQKTEDNLLASMLQAIKKPISNYKKYRSFYEFEDVIEGVEQANILWALKDVNFEVRQGEVFGIVGANGAGKSTLLKVLTQITPPSTGSIRIKGRVSSLLEVGTGFHPELTGRENVFLNGTMLGMTKADVVQRFDDIVGFSGVSKFLDTPVKRYSSGMRVRLAFAVAAHLEPEVLLIDEVLAVGDAAFQRKCLNKMEDSGKEGRTVLFVSHNLPALTRLCSRAILLRNGQVTMDASAAQVVANYLQDEERHTAKREWFDADAPGDEIVKLRSVCVKNTQGQSLESYEIDQAIGIEMQYEVLESGHALVPHFGLVNDQGVNVFVALETDIAWHGKPRKAGKYTTTGWIPKNMLSEGILYVFVCMGTLEPWSSHFTVTDAIAFHVADSQDGTTARGKYSGDMEGVVRPMLEWETTTSP